MKKENWILLKDKLPEVKQYVLISRNCGEYKRYYVEVAVLQKSDYSNELYWTGSCSYTKLEDVSAWQPLPDPYIPENKTKFKKINGALGDIYIRKVDGWCHDTINEELHVRYKDIKKLFGNCNLLTCQYVDSAWGIEDKSGRVAAISCHKHDKRPEINSWRIDGDKSLIVDIFGKDKIK